MVSQSEVTTSLYRVHNRYGSDKIESCRERVESEGNKGIQLKRELGLFSAVSLIVGVMIGSGIFISPTSALARSGSVGLCLVIWASCGMISLLGALCFAELGTVVPKSGAEYAYFEEAFSQLHPFWGPLPSFTCAWIYAIILRPAEVAVVCLTFSEYVTQPFAHSFASIPKDDKDLLKKLLAIAALGLMTAINYLGVKLYVKMQNVFAVLKLLACAVIIVGGIYALSTGHTGHFEKPFEGTTSSVKDIALAFYSGLWAYDGWCTVTIVTEEVKRPEVNIPRSIAIAVPLVTGLYFMMNVAYMAVLSVPEMLAAPAVAVVFGDRLLGLFNFIIPIGVALSTFGCALSVQFSVARLCYVAARGGHMAEVLSYVHLRRLTPAPAIVIQGILTLLFIAAGNIYALIDFSSFLVWIFYGLAMVALLVMRVTKKNANRPYKVPALVPVLFIMVAIFLVVLPIATDPSPKYLFALLFIAIGVTLYTPLVYYKKTPNRFMSKLTFVTQVLLEVVPTNGEVN